MKMKNKNRSKKIYMIAGIVFIGIIIIFLWKQNQETFIEPEQVALVKGVPYAIIDGGVYQYEKDGAWSNLELKKEAQQIENGENLCILNTDGSLYYDGELDPNVKGYPLTSLYGIYMSVLALEKNQEEPYMYINNNLDYLDFRALLQNGEILYQGMEQYERYQMEEIPTQLSGSYILTEQGNVFYLYIDSRGDAPMYIELKCVYDGGDITTIDATTTGSICLGLRSNGTVLSWSIYGELDVVEWSNIREIEQGYNYAVGLTEKGKVLYIDYDSNSTQVIAKELKKWKNIVQIATDDNIIVGVQSDGVCLFLDLELYR